jgi:hypothetical protein
VAVSVTDFSDRYAVASFSDGEGILVDLSTGGYFKLNATAVLICNVLQLAGTTNEAIDLIVQHMHVTTAEANRLVAVVRENLSQVPPRTPSSSPLVYGRHPDGSWVLEENGRTIFSIADEKRQVELRASLSQLNAPLLFYLQALVPKLLALLDIPVMHAAACRIGGRHLAFSGKSGAGKTTSALAFERAGAHLVSEDLLVLSVTEQDVKIHLGGERYARDWARRIAPVLEKDCRQVIDFGVLADARTGDIVTLDTIWFIEAERRGGSDLKLQKLPISDGALALLGNGFLASFYPQQWRDFLYRSQRIAERVELTQAIMPEGLGLLQSAARGYMVNSAS